MSLRELVRGLERGGRNATFAVPAADRLELLRLELERWLRDGGPPGEEALSAAGLRHRTATAGDALATVLTRRGEAVDGTGTFAFRSNPPGPSVVVLQAPHCFHDKGTGDIALGLFELGLGHALFRNTIHRYQPGDREHTDHPADVAHNPVNFFHAATVALSGAWPGAVFVQIHGFSRNHRKDLSRSADFVLADGRPPRAPPEGLLARAAAAFEKTFGAGRVAVHGRDTRELGATTNAQGRHLNGLGPDRFLHVEISAEQRRLLRESPEELEKLRAAISAATETPPAAR